MEEDEADSDDEWADTAEAAAKRDVDDGSLVTLEEGNVASSIHEEDLLISAVDQVTLFGSSLSKYGSHAYQNLTAPFVWSPISLITTHFPPISKSCTKSGWMRKANGWTAVAAQYERSKKRWFELHGGKASS